MGTIFPSFYFIAIVVDKLNKQPRRSLHENLHEQ